MDLSKIKTIYMIGIKGVGMTMLAEFLAHEGFQVSGSDTAEVFMTDAILGKAGIKVFQGFNIEQVNLQADLVIYSSAYTETNNEELNFVLQKNMKVVQYAEALAAVFNDRFGVAVCGSHGKTTTSAWLGFVLRECGLEPNVMVGSGVPQFNGAGLVGKSNTLVIEADEYQNKLKHFNPKMILLNNIDYDHPDFFPDVAAYEQVFIEFIFKLPKSGTLIANYDDTRLKAIAPAYCKGNVISYGEAKDCDYVISNIEWDGQKQFFKLQLRDEDGLSDIGEFSILLNGKHNVHNATAVIIAAIELNGDLHLIRKAVGEFTGTSRRMQKMGEYKGAIIVDDYAHHPTEIKASLAAAKEKWPKKKIRVVFHPHTFSRTAALLDNFAQSFNNADEVIILDIYSSAREQVGTINSAVLSDRIKAVQEDKKELRYIPSFQEAESYLKDSIGDNNVIILMGAGDVFRIGEALLKHDV